MLYYYGDKVHKDLQGETDHQDAQDTDSMALQTMMREAIESFKASPVEEFKDAQGWLRRKKLEKRAK